MSAGNVITQIRRDAGRHDYIPAYSTDELLRGVCHLTYVPQKDENCLEISSVCSPGNAEKKRRSINKFNANKEEIYMLLAQGRGVKCVADRFRIGYGALTKYLKEESK